MIDELSKLLAIDINQIIDSGDRLFSFQEIEEKLELLLTTTKDAVDNQQYLAELPELVQVNIRENLSGLVAVLNEIKMNKNNRDWVTANYTNKCAQIVQIYNELYDYYVRGVREYVNSLSTSKKATKQALTQLKQATRKAVETSEKTDDTLKLAGEATSDISIAVLSEHFDNEVLTFAPAKEIPTISWWYRFKLWRLFWRRWFSAKGYDVEAGRWLVLTLLAVLATSILAFVEFHGNNIDLKIVTLNTVLAKGLLLAAPAYAIRFCVRNYNANKHLATVNRQRAVVMKTLLALLAHPGISSMTQEQVIVGAVTQVFTLSESGYITLRDGAGNQDSVIDLATLIKKS